jgi:Kef-type K+ transport system membrane component KefB
VVRGRPLTLAVLGWFLSLALAYSIAGLLAAAGLVISGVLTGSAMSTTAIGTLLPVLRDNDQLGGRFGPAMLAAGAVGELGPILIVTLVLTTTSDRVSQALLLGAFAAGMIVRGILQNQEEVEALNSKLEAIGFGFLIPFFFIHSGMALDLSALTSGFDAVLKVPLFLLAFLVVRGTPALLLYRKDFGLTDRIGLGLFSATQLPIVVAITSLGVSEHEMRPSTAVALVTAAVLSVLIFPTVAIAIRSRVGKPSATPASA